MNYTDEMIQFIIQLKKAGNTWEELTLKFNENFAHELDSPKTWNALRKTHTRYKDMDLNDDNYLSNLKQVHTAKKASSKIAKDNKIILDSLTNRSSVLEEVKELFKQVKFSKPKAVKFKKDKKKKNMTLEVMLTDLHYGKLTDRFNFQIARKYMRKMADTVLGEIERESKNFNVEKVIGLLGGDLLENATMHGLESMRSSEASNSEQIRAAIESIFEDFIVPVASSGRNIEFICVTGNHDREGMNKTYNNPGKEHFTWIIYNTLQMLTKAAKLKNVSFIIPEGTYSVYEVYGSTAILEHGDFIKGGMTRNATEGHLAKRGTQIGKIIDFMRLGHFHELTMYGRGKIIVNGSFPGQDSYAEINGYHSTSVQVINYYVETKSRPNPYYKSFPVYLDE